jgi:hypothetical protein
MFVKVSEPAEEALMALPLLLPKKLVVTYIEASYHVGVCTLDGECGELYEGLPCMYI